MICNFFILWLTKLLTRNQTSHWRIIIGATVATIIVPITLYYPHTFINSFFGKTLYSLLIIYSAFRIHSWKQLYQLLMMFYFNAFAIGGSIFAIHYVSQDFLGSISTSAGLLAVNAQGEKISITLVIIGFIASVYFTKQRMDKHALVKLRQHDVYNMVLSILGKEVSTTGFFDTGNQLEDPLTRKPIIVCDESLLTQFFSESQWLAIKRWIGSGQQENVPEFVQKKLFIVPYQTVEGKISYLYALKPDYLQLDYDGQEIKVTQCLVGIQLAALTTDAKYHCLLHPKIMQAYQLRVAS